MKNNEYFDLLNGLYTLEEVTKSDDESFEDRIESIISGMSWEGSIEGISKKRIINLMEKDGVGNPVYSDPEYKVAEKFWDNIMNASKEIASFLKSKPKDILYFWDPNNIGGATEPDPEEYSLLISKAFGEFFDMGEWGVITPKKELGSPISAITFSEGPDGGRGYEHWVRMYESKGGERFCLQGSYSGDHWMCTRSLIESLLSEI